jgi:hypothetical protein
MKHSAGGCKTPSKLSESTHHRLNMYALAASAAGVGALIAPNSADAKIVYTPTDVKINGIYKLISTMMVRPISCSSRMVALRGRGAHI